MSGHGVVDIAVTELWEHTTAKRLASWLETLA